MDIRVYSEEYRNVTVINAKKIKLKGADLEKVASQKPSFTVPVKPSPVDVKPEKPVETEKPSFVYGSEIGKMPYELNEEKIKAKVAGNYGGYKETIKHEHKDVEVEKPKVVTEKEFEDLLNTPVTIMKDEMEMYKAVYDQKKARLNEEKAKQVRLADTFQKISNEDQSAKSDNEGRKNRTAEMKKSDNFQYLEIGANEDPRVIEAIQQVDEALKNLLNTNLTVYNETEAKIKQYAEAKIDIDKESEKVRDTIKKLTESRYSFFAKHTPTIRNIIEVSKSYTATEAASKKAIQDEYEEVARDARIEEPVIQTRDNSGIENNEIGINYVNPNQSVVNIEPYLNSFEEDAQAYRNLA